MSLELKRYTLASPPKTKTIQMNEGAIITGCNVENDVVAIYALCDPECGNVGQKVEVFQTGDSIDFANMGQRMMVGIADVSGTIYHIFRESNIN